jgi:hypothetical protein
MTWYRSSAVVAELSSVARKSARATSPVGEQFDRLVGQRQ